MAISILKMSFTIKCWQRCFRIQTNNLGPQAQRKWLPGETSLNFSSPAKYTNEINWLKQTILNVLIFYS